MANSEPKSAVITSNKKDTPTRFWCGKEHHWSHDRADAKPIDVSNYEEEMYEAQLQSEGDGRTVSLLADEGDDK